MRLYRDFDTIDLLRAAEHICGSKRLEDQGLNRRGLRGTKRALAWLSDGIVRSMKARSKRWKKR